MSYQIFQFSTIGNFHTQHNEDYHIVTEINDQVKLLAVMDGCSMGKDSYFASTLIGKILRQIAKEISYKTYYEKTKWQLSNLLKEVTKQLFNKLIVAKSQLGLERIELLSTMVLAIVDTELKTAEILTIGDGIIYFNGNVIEYDQDNTPDYLGYHLAKDFETWFLDQNQRLSLSNIQQLGIATDGLLTFTKFGYRIDSDLNIEWITRQFFLDANEIDAENPIRQRFYVLEKEYGWRPSDDFTMIRLIFTPCDTRENTNFTTSHLTF